MLYSNEEKTQWLEKWRLSGKSAWTFAKENGLVPQTFCKWTKSGSKIKSGFVEIKTPHGISVPGSPEILIEKGEMKIHVPIGLSSSELRVVMEVLGGSL